jgi:hypothetical protein
VYFCSILYIFTLNGYGFELVDRDYNSILLYELHKTVIVEREGLGHDEHSEECLDWPHTTDF